MYTILLSDVEPVICLLCEWELDGSYDIAWNMCRDCEDEYYVKTKEAQDWWQSQINPEG